MKNPGIELEWVTLEESALRQPVTTDVTAKGGQYDIMTIGTYEVPIWGGQGWLVSLNDLRLIPGLHRSNNERRTNP